MASPAAAPGPAAPDLATLAGAVTARYAAASRFSRNFARGKLLSDPATAAVLRLAAGAGGFGAVADLGCGRGQVGLALLLAGLAERVHGLDLDPGKIRDAAGAGAGLPAAFAVADLGAAALPDCDTAMVLDVLLLMPEPAQRRLLAAMTAARRRVLIRAFDPDRGWRSRLGAVTEEIGRAVRRDGPAIRPLPLGALAAPFEAAGFEVTVAPCWGWTPLPNVMLVAERRRP